jgi:hypothetical protein
MANYLIYVRASSEEQPYVIDISPSGNSGVGSLTRHKLYDADSLRKDMKDCLNANDAGFLNVLKIISETDEFTIERSLSAECASRLGWYE